MHLNGSFVFGATAAGGGRALWTGASPRTNTNRRSDVSASRQRARAYDRGEDLARRSDDSSTLPGDATELFRCAQRLCFPAATEAIFLEAYHRASVTSCRAAFVVAFFLYSAFGYLDFWGVPSARNAVWTIRYLIVCPTIAGAFLLTFLPKYKKAMQWVAAFVVIVAGFGIVAMIAISKPDEPAYSQYYVGLLLVVAFGYTFVRLRLRFALVAVGIVLGSYELVAFLQQSSPLAQERVSFLMSSTFFLVSANILGGSASYFLELYMRRDFVYRRTIEGELIGAREMQQRLLPTTFPAIPGLAIAGACRMSRQVGGDYFDVLSAGRDRWLFVIADVSGKGAAAALVTANLHAIIRTLPHCEALPEIAKCLNDYLLTTMHQSRYVTTILALYQPSARKLQYLNAGHNGGFVLGPHGERQSLESSGVPLGLFQDACWDVREVLLSPGAMLLLYTDGIVERFNAAGETYDEDRLALAALRCARSGAGPTLRRVLEENDAFAGTVDVADDATMLVACVKTESSILYA